MIKEPSCTPHVQLCDFGLSIRFEKFEMIHGKLGTMMYMAPEVLQGEPYNEKCDVWGVGVCSFIISTQADPWGESSGQELGERIAFNLREPYPKHQPKDLRLLVEGMLVRKVSEDRPRRKFSEDRGGCGGMAIRIRL